MMQICRDKRVGMGERSGEDIRLEANPRVLAGVPPGGPVSTKLPFTGIFSYLMC
jgi:hypothetical protein